MFTLGNKEAICNSNAKFKVKTDGTRITVQGFGTFDQGQIKEYFAQRFVTPRNGYLEIVAPTAADLGILNAQKNVPVVVHIRVNTTRHSSEWAIDFIKRGRPFIFEIMVNGTDTGVDIANKLMAAFAEYEAKFNYADRGLPFTWTSYAPTIALSLKDPYLSFQKYVDFLAKGDTYGFKVDTFTSQHIGVTGGSGTSFTIDTSTATGTVPPVYVGDVLKDVNGNEARITDLSWSGTDLTVTVDSALDAGAMSLYVAPQEPNFDGKYLEENVRMSLPTTSDSYGISPDEKPIISGSYATVSWRAVDTQAGGVDLRYKRHKGLGATRGELLGDREARFTVYFLEGSDAMQDSGSGGAAGTENNAEQIIEFLRGTPATGELKLGDGTVVTTTPDWLA